MARHFTRLITTPAAARMSREWNRPFVSLLTDFGLRDPSPAICHGVVLGIAPDALIVDISHEVEKFQVRDAALLLWSALPYLPVGSHVAVVDPGVGTERRGIAIEVARGDMLVGPDNGLLLPGAERLGGIVRVHELLNAQYRLPVVTSSFHGRDVFAPAAAHLALGVPLEMMGPPVDPADLEVLDWPQPEVTEGELVAAVVYLDTFGNVKLAALAHELSAALGPVPEGARISVRLGRARHAREEVVTFAQTFGRVSVGEPLLYEDSYGRLCIAVNQGSAVERLGLRDGQEIVLRLADQPAPASADETTTQLVPVGAFAPLEAAVPPLPPPPVTSVPPMPSLPVDGPGGPPRSVADSTVPVSPLAAAEYEVQRESDFAIEPLPHAATAEPLPRAATAEPTSVRALPTDETAAWERPERQWPAGGRAPAEMAAAVGAGEPFPPAPIERVRDPLVGDAESDGDAAEAGPPAPDVPAEADAVAVVEMPAQGEVHVPDEEAWESWMDAAPANPVTNEPVTDDTSTDDTSTGDTSTGDAATAEATAFTSPTSEPEPSGTDVAAGGTTPAATTPEDDAWLSWRLPDDQSGDEGTATPRS